MRKEAAQRDKEASLRRIVGTYRGKDLPKQDSKTGLGRDINASWENMEQPVSSGKQHMVVRQTEPPRAQNLPTERGTQRQVYTIEGDEAPATPAKQRGPSGQQQGNELQRHKRGRN